MFGADHRGYVLFSDAPRNAAAQIVVRDSVEVWRVQTTTAAVSRAFGGRRERLPPPVATTRRQGGRVTSSTSTSVSGSAGLRPAYHVVSGAEKVALVEDSTWRVVLRDFDGRRVGQFTAPRPDAARVRAALARDGGTLRAWRMLFDPTGRLWVQEPLPSSTGQSRWTIHSGTGAVLGHAMLPARINVMAIGTDVIVGIARDPDGIQSVEVYPLQPVR